MYLHYFGLREYPFSLTPDTSFFFDHPGHPRHGLGGAVIRAPITRGSDLRLPFRG